MTLVTEKLIALFCFILLYLALYRLLRFSGEALSPRGTPETKGELVEPGRIELPTS